ncbi:hypothetical protein GF345_05250 [Candidatus Woesearchaeota archaeon]|nr:hypothetical protein [Candidatus Woesearchaeota archaeon]
MPQGDRTGPMGQGSRTGIARGFCSGYNGPGYMNPDFGRRLGPGFNRSRGFCRGFGRRAWQPAESAYPSEPAYAEPTKDQEKHMLEQEARAIDEEEKALKEEKDSIKKRLEELK